MIRPAPHDPRPLLRRPRVVVTRDEGPSGPLAMSLESQGADVLAMPTIAIGPPQDFMLLDRALDDPDGFDWVLFTSAHAVETVASRPGWSEWRERAASPFTGARACRFAAAGKRTADALARLGITAELVPEQEGADGLAAVFLAASRAARSLSGVRVLWPRSDIAGRGLADRLRVAGVELLEVVAYSTVPAIAAEGEASGVGRASGPVGPLAVFWKGLEAGEIDAITFMSPSSALGFAAALGSPDLSPIAGRAVIASIGPTTSAALRKLGADVDVESPSRSARDLASALMSHLQELRESPG